MLMIALFLFGTLYFQLLLSCGYFVRNMTVALTDTCMCRELLEYFDLASLDEKKPN